MRLEKNLNPRDIYGGSDWSGGARWAFFGIFLVLIIVLMIGTLKINRNRARQGISPIYGTRWMTPPSYFQSQGQYNQPTSGEVDMPNVYVPTYTATANDNDMGYYDAQGNFHANPNSKGPELPESAHRRTTTNSDGIPLNNVEVGGEPDENSATSFQRPSHPPPSHRY